MGLLFDPPRFYIRNIPSSALHPFAVYTIDISHGSPATHMYNYHCVMFRKYQSFDVLALHLVFQSDVKGS